MKQTIVPVTSVSAVNGYSCDAYGRNNYGQCSSQAQQQAWYNLAGTGYDLLIPLALALSIIIASTILVIKRLRRKYRRRG